MAASLNHCLHDLRRAMDIPSVTAILDGFLSPRGLDSFLFYDPGAPLARSALVRNFDPGLIARFDRQSVWRSDPLRLQTRHQPLIWDAGKSEAETPEACELVWEPMAAAGFRHLVAVPIYGPLGHCDVFAAIAGEQRRPRRKGDREIDDLVLIAYNLAGFFRRGPCSEPKAAITRREIECLHWTARGKTAWEVGRILGISERTARFHLRNAMHKLDSPSKHQAALKALQAGMIAL